MRRPDSRIAGSARPPGGEQGVELGHGLRLNEEIRERRVGCIGRCRRQHELAIGGQLDLARLCPEVHERDPANLCVVFGGDHDFERGRDRAVAPAKLRSVLGERDLVGVRLDGGRLVGRRPDCSALGIPQEDVRAPVIARDVLAPAGDGASGALAVARPRGRQHHRVASVGEQVGPRSPVVGRSELAEDRLDEIAHLRRRLDLVDPGAGDRHAAGRPLLQQQLGRLDDGFGVEARAHRTGPEDIGERDQRHPLMMGHVGAHHGHLRPFREPGPRVVERLVEPERPPRARPRERDEVAGRRPGVDHRRQPGRVGSDHEVLAESSLEAEAGHAEVRVLVGEFEIAHVVGGFGDSPGDAVCGAVRPLAADHQARGLVQQARRRRIHDQRRHEVLEHRPRPGDEGRAQLDGCHRPREPEPV